MLVEDDSSLLSALTFALELDGFRVRAYDRGTAAAGDGEAASADCLVVDLKLPDVDGLDLVALLRAKGVTAPAIVITTNPDERRRREAAGAGVTIVEKPLMDGELSHHIGLALARGHDIVR
ncbi:MAG TPA: response regulator [Caulobacteraceae bacterium]